MLAGKKLKRVFPWAVVGLVIAFLGSCAPAGTTGTGGVTGPTVGTTTGQEKTYVIRMHHGLPIGHFMEQAEMVWVEKVEELSRGRIRVEVYPSAQLYKDTTCLEAVRAGALECAATYNYILDREITELYPLEAGYISDEVMLAILEGEIGKEFERAFEQRGLKLVMQIPWGCIQGPSTVGSPIVTPEDLRGRKLRMGSGSEFYAPAIRDKGGIPVSLTGAELYMGLQRGTIDSIMMCASSHLLDRKLYEVQDSWTPIPPVTSVNSIIFMNKKFFDGLPVDLQQVVLKANAEAYQEVKEVGSFQHLLQREKLEEENLINIHEITQEEGKVWLEWINPYVMEVMRTKSLEGREIFNMIQKLKEDMGDEPMPRLE